MSKISNKSKREVKRELNAKIGQYLIANKGIEDAEVAKKFGVSSRTIGAIKAHITMGSYSTTKVENNDFSIVGLTKKEIGLKIAKYIIANGNEDLRVIAKNFNVGYRTVTAIKAHVSMGHYGNEGKKVTKKVEKTRRVYGKGKLESRKMQCNAILKSGKIGGTILTLSGKDLTMELMLSTHRLGKKFRYDIVERDKGVFNLILKNPITSSINVSSINHTTMKGMILNSPSNKYSHAILDYFDCLSTNIHDIAYALDKDIIQIGGVIALTLCSRDSVNAVAKDGDCANLVEVMNFLSKFKRYEIIEKMTYADGMPMMVLIIKRNK